jgi:hypothetical protein
MTPTEIAAREGVRDTLSRYAHAADSGHFGDLVSLFTEDGVMDVEGREPFRGHEAILGFLTSTKQSLR